MYHNRLWVCVLGVCKKCIWQSLYGKKKFRLLFAYLHMHTSVSVQSDRKGMRHDEVDFLLFCAASRRATTPCWQPDSKGTKKCYIHPASRDYKKHCEEQKQTFAATLIIMDLHFTWKSSKVSLAYSKYFPFILSGIAYYIRSASPLLSIKKEYLYWP